MREMSITFRMPIRPDSNTGDRQATIDRIAARLFVQNEPNLSSTPIEDLNILANNRRAHLCRSPRMQNKPNAGGPTAVDEFGQPYHDHNPTHHTYGSRASPHKSESAKRSQSTPFHSQLGGVPTELAPEGLAPKERCEPRDILCNHEKTRKTKPILQERNERNLFPSKSLQPVTPRQRNRKRSQSTPFHSQLSFVPTELAPEGHGEPRDLPFGQEIPCKTNPIP